MKKIKNTLLSSLILVSAVLSISSCELVELDNKTYGKLAPGSFPKTEAELKSTVIAAYNAVSAGYINRYPQNSPGYILSELPTDELNTSYGAPWQAWDRFQWQPNHAGGTSLETPFNQFSRGVTNATIALSYATQSTVPTKDAYIAEIRALRAFLAFMLYDMYGPVPLLLKENETVPDPNYRPAKPSKEEYVQFLENDLVEAIPNLKTKTTTVAADWGRIDKGTALTILLKLYLKEKRWADVVKTADKITELNEYFLYDNYLDIFTVANEGKSNKEAIFVLSRAITATASYSNGLNALFLIPTPKIGKLDDGTVLPTAMTGTIYGGIKVPWDMYDKFEATDRRRKGLIRFYYAGTSNTLTDYRSVTDSKATGAGVIKWGLDPGASGDMQSNDFILYRYADVLLAKAEALNEINGPNQTSVDLINQINKRAFNVNAKYTLTNPAFASKEAFRNFILDERFRELYLEGHRRQDLIRHDKFVEKAKDAGWAASAKHNVFPIPQSAINQNPNLIQNTDY